MKYLPLVLAGLWRKPARTIFTFLSVTVAFILFGILAGLNAGIAHVVDASRLDRLYVDAKFGAPMPLNYQDRIAAIPGVALVAPRAMLVGYYQDPKNGVAAQSSDQRFFSLRPELTATKADIDKLMNTRTGVIAGTYYIKKYGWKVGEKISVISRTLKKDGTKNWTFDIVAITDDANYPGSAGFFIVNYKYIDEARASGSGNADRFLVRIAEPTQASQISHTIDALFANSPAPTRTSSEKSTQQRNLSQLGDINFFVRTIISAVLFMLLFLTGNTMMQSVRERVPEFAVLKTLGFTDTGVLVLVIAEAVVLCAAAGLTGLLIVKIALPIVKAHVANGNLNLLQMTWGAMGTGFAFAVGMALIASIIPALRVKQLNVVDALAGR